MTQESGGKTAEATVEPLTPGQLLRRERERRSLSVQQAAEDLHLDASTVEAIEADRLAALGAPVYAKGHLKKYAALLGLSPADVIQRYEALSDTPVVADPIPATVAAPATTIARFLARTAIFFEIGTGVAEAAARGSASVDPLSKKLDAAYPGAGEAVILADLGIASGHVHDAPGCSECNQTGFRGRTGVYELLLVDDAIRRGIHDGADEIALRDAATRAGMTSLRRDGARWIASGATSLAELVRVTRE